jgi:hypothetical protein
MSNLLQFKITLDSIEPPIWRRFEVIDELTFYELHQVIQVVMGWENCHLYEFVYEEVSTIGDRQLLDRSGVVDDVDISLDSIFDDPGLEMRYSYDFGDGWDHTLLLEKITQVDKPKYLAKCLEGERNCPPEDCGGPPGYDNLVDVMVNKIQPDYDDLKSWFGSVFKPEKFDLKKINSILKQVR